LRRTALSLSLVRANDYGKNIGYGKVITTIDIEIARVLNMSQPAIRRSSRRGKKIARENQFKLINN